MIVWQGRDQRADTRNGDSKKERRGIRTVEGNGSTGGYSRATRPGFEIEAECVGYSIVTAWNDRRNLFEVGGRSKAGGRIVSRPFSAWGIEIRSQGETGMIGREKAHNSQRC